MEFGRGQQVAFVVKNVTRDERNVFVRIDGATQRDPSRITPVRYDQNEVY
jgi:hypothetical protein